jgi:predicted dehydrogenase
MRLGLIGCGWIVERGHAPALQRAEGVEVVATADPAGDRALRLGHLFRLGPDACYTDYRALLERPDVEAVTVATPPATHREIVTLAAEAGKHVLCEKPLATTLADADAMIEVCRHHGVILAVVHNYLYFPETIKARELIAQGAIGEVVTTEITGLGLRPWSGAEEFRPRWRYDRNYAGGGALMDAGWHGLYLSATYHGHPITAIGATMHYEETGVDKYAFCQVHLGSRFGLVNVAWGEGDAALSIGGTSGHLRFVYDEWAGYYGQAARAIRQMAVGQPSQTHYLPPVRDMVSPQLHRDFKRAVEGEEDAYPAHGEAGRTILEVVTAAYKAAVAGVPVSLPLATSDPVYAQGISALPRQS